MPDQGIAQIIFPDSKDLETFLKEQGSYDLHEDLLKYGLTTKQFYTLTIKVSNTKKLSILFLITNLPTKLN